MPIPLKFGFPGYTIYAQAIASYIAGRVREHSYFVNNGFNVKEPLLIDDGYGRMLFGSNWARVVKVDELPYIGVANRHTINPRSNSRFERGCVTDLIMILSDYNPTLLMRKLERAQMELEYISEQVLTSFDHNILRPTKPKVRSAIIDPGNETLSGIEQKGRHGLKFIKVHKQYITRVTICSNSLIYGG